MWTSQSVACSSGAHASYPVLVHRVAPLLRASFRPRLAAAPLRFANPSPPSGWVEDLHLLAVEHARHTTGPARCASLPYLRLAPPTAQRPARRGPVARSQSTARGNAAPRLSTFSRPLLHRRSARSIRRPVERTSEVHGREGKGRGAFEARR